MSIVPGGTAERMVSGPSTGLLISGILNVIFSALALVGKPNRGRNGRNGGRTARLADNGFWHLWNSLDLVFLGVGALVIFGSQKMKKLENYGLAMASAILTVIPCTTCCLWGIPIGIWAIITLNKPEVKSAFH